MCPGIEVVGGKGDNAAAVTREVGDGDNVMVGALKIGRSLVLMSALYTSLCVHSVLLFLFFGRGVTWLTCVSTFSSQGCSTPPATHQGT